LEQKGKHLSPWLDLSCPIDPPKALF